MRFKFFTYAISLIPLFITTGTTAETIYFHGAIVEDSCSLSSSNIECKHLTPAINNVKTTDEVDHLLMKKAKDVAHMYISDTSENSDMSKILVVDYH